MTVRTADVKVCRLTSPWRVGARRIVETVLELARTAWAMATAALIGVFLWAAVALPERVPQHVDVDGVVTEWSSRAAFLGSMGIAIVMSSVLGPLARGISRSMSLDMVNVPFKDRWLPDHEPELRRRVATDLYAVGAAVSVMLAAIQAGLVVVALGAPTMPTWSSGIAIVAGIGLGLVVLAMVSTRYRRPGD